MTIVDLDGATGQPKWQIAAAGVFGANGTVYCYPDDVKAMEPQIAIRGDGSVVIAAMTNNGLPPLTIDGSVQIPIVSSTSTDPSGVQFADFSPMGPPMVNTDGNTYVEYEVRQIAYPPKITSAVLHLLQIAPDNTIRNIQLASTTEDTNLLPGRIIPDGQGGVLATWTISPSNPPSPTHPYQASHVVSGIPGTPYDLPFTPTTVAVGQYPTLVLGEGSTAFATNGTDADNGPVVASFDLTSGAVIWSYQASSQSTLAVMASISDGGVAINDSANGILQFDTTGNPLQLTGATSDVAEYSWGGNWYMQAGQAASKIMLPLDVDPAGIWATPGGNPSHTSSVGALCGCLLQTTDTSAETASAVGGFNQSKVATLSTPSVLSTTVANCPICNLPPPTQGLQQAPSCRVFPGASPTYLILIGDPGLDPHNAHQGFNLAAQTEANSWQSLGNKVVACRVSSVENVVTALTSQGSIDGGIIYFGHSGPFGPIDQATNRTLWLISVLEVGEGTGDSTNVSFRNVGQISAVLTASAGGQNIIGPNASILLNGCRAAETIYDHYAIFETSIAQLLANNTRRGVYAYKASTYFSIKDREHAQSSNWTGEPNPLPEHVPIYLIPEGKPGLKPPRIPFTPTAN